MSLTIETSISFSFHDKVTTHKQNFSHSWERVRWTQLQIVQHVTAGKAICVAALNGSHRKTEHFASSQLLALDIDEGDYSLDDLRQVALIRQHAFFIGQTASSTPAVKRWRVLFALDQPITDITHWKRLAQGLIDHALRHGLCVDVACKDPVRFYYGSTHADHHLWPDAVLPVVMMEKLIADADAPAWDEPVFREWRTATDGDRQSAYLQAALDNEVAAMRAAPEGSRNHQLNKSAFALGQLIGPGKLERSTVERELTAAALSAGLPADEIAATLKSGLVAGMTQPREIPQGEVKGSKEWMRQRRTVGGPDPDEEEGQDAMPDTFPYQITVDGRMQVITKVTHKDDVPVHETKDIADFHARIVGEVRSTDGTVIYTLKGRNTQGQTFNIEINGEDFNSPAKLKNALSLAAGPRCPVHARMQEHLAPAVQKLTQETTTCRRMERLGWYKDDFIIPGNLPADVRVDLPDKLPYRLDGDADLKTGLNVLGHLIQAFRPDLTLPIIAFALQGPLARSMGWRNERYALVIQGRTGSLKTSFAQCVMQLYGTDFANDANLVKWGEGATRNAIMHMATWPGDLPLLLDNFKPNTGGGTRDFVNLIHNILEGGEKDRLRRSGDLRAARPVDCWVLVTSEDLPDEDPATLARTLVITLDWQRGGENTYLSAAQAAGKHLNAVGRAWIGWLTNDASNGVMTEAKALFPERRQAWADYLRASSADMANIMRVATNLASNELTLWVAAQCPAIGGILKPHISQHLTGLQAIASTMTVSASTALPAQQFLNALSQLLASGRVIIAEDRDSIQQAEPYLTVIGCKADNGDGVYLLPEVAKNAALKLLGPDGLGHASNKVIYQQLDELGYIASHDKGRHTKKQRIGGGTASVLHLKACALTDEFSSAETIN